MNSSEFTGIERGFYLAFHLLHTSAQANKPTPARCVGNNSAHIVSYGPYSVYYPVDIINISAISSNEIARQLCIGI